MLLDDLVVDVMGLYCSIVSATFLSSFFLFFFFFQAEDGIRDIGVTGVQTCALPILRELRRVAAPGALLLSTVPAYTWLWSRHDDEHHHFRRYTWRRLRARLRDAGWRPLTWSYFNTLLRSEERRVGKEGRSGWWA